MLYILRATAYGMWSLLVPVGYNRDPAAHFGYKKVAMILEHTYTVNEEELVTEKDITRSRGKECIWHIYKFYITRIHLITTTSISFCIFMFKRSPQQIFLTMHILTSIFVLGVSLIFMLIIIHSNPTHYYQQTILTPEVSLTRSCIKYENRFNV